MCDSTKEDGQGDIVTEFPVAYVLSNDDLGVFLGVNDGYGMWSKSDWAAMVSEDALIAATTFETPEEAHDFMESTGMTAYVEEWEVVEVDADQKGFATPFSCRASGLHFWGPGVMIH